MSWLVCLCVVLTITVIVLSVKIVLMRKAAEEIRTGFAEKLENDTNTLLSISTNDKAMRRLASEINVELRSLRSQRRRYVQGDNELKNAVTNISHDLRTPLTAIGGYLELLEKTEKSEAAERYLGIIRNRTELMRQLTEELFRYSVILSPEQETQMEAVAVNGVLEESIVGFYAVMREQGITPEIRMPEGKVVRRADRAALARVFSNLLHNAVKYSDGDLRITLTEDGEVTFANSTSELSEVEVERLFDRFYTVENARKSTGLGLSIARALLEQMNGTISASYRNGRLEIRVWLPEAE